MIIFLIIHNNRYKLDQLSNVIANIITNMADVKIAYERINELYENENYSEAIELCEFIKTITDTAPVWSLIGDIYRTLKMYGKSIEAYKYYLKLNEDDDEATETLKEIYEEALS